MRGGINWQMVEEVIKVSGKEAKGCQKRKEVEVWKVKLEGGLQVEGDKGKQKEEG